MAINVPAGRIITDAQLQQYCSDHGLGVAVHHMHWGELAFWAAVLGLGIYALVRFVPVVWSDIKGLFTSAKAGVEAGVTKVEAAV